MAKTITAFLLLILPLQLQAQNQDQGQEYLRILVLHGLWSTDVWEGNYDQALKAQFGQLGKNNIDVSFRYLGLDSALTDDAYTVLKREIEGTIQRQSVNLIVGVLPAASGFLMDLDGVEDLPKILVLPGEAIIEQASQLENIGIIKNASTNAINTTIEQILRLLPDITTIEVISGSSDGDLVFMNRAKNVAENYQDQVAFNFHVGRDPQETLAWSETLPPTSVILTMPYNSYGEVATPIKIDFRPLLEQHTAVPIFGFYDSLLGFGIVGGHLSSTEGYANATLEMSQILARGKPLTPVLMEGTATTIYDWRQVKKWNLELNRLDSDYQVFFRPPSLWETNRTLVITVVNIIILLAALSIILGIFLQRSRHSQALVAASERQARISEKQYRLLALNSVDVIWTWNSETNTIDYCSPSIRTLTGFIPEQYLQKKLSDILTPDSIAAFNEVINQTPRRAELIEVQHYTNTGKAIWCEIALQPAQESSNRNLWVAVTRDISQRKIAEQERAQLEGKIRQHQKFESLGTLAGGIAHDFNNILGIFVGVAEMLETQVKDNKQAMRLLTRLRSATERAKALVNQILTFSRRSVGSKTVVDFADLLREALDLISVGIPRSVKIDTDIAVGSVKIYGDANQLEQVILNLVTNAFESIADDNGRISITLRQQVFAREQTFKFGNVRVGDYAMLEIRDTGIGMQSEDLERAFDPFYTSKALGSGMGLAIVHGIVMEHDGCINFESKPGEGTAFTLYFPISELEQGNFKPPSLVHDIARPLKILAIDDQPELLEVLQLLLRSMGHQCDTCDDPQQALSIIKEKHEALDLVITDYSMPEINGLDLIRYCENQCPELAVILCSGYGDQIPKEFFENRKNCLFLDKPVDKDALNHAMAQLIGDNTIENTRTVRSSAN